MTFTPTQFLVEDTKSFPYPNKTIAAENWIRLNEIECSFELRHFTSVSLNLIKNPNINSSVLFRADIFYDSHDGDLVDAEPTHATVEELREWDHDKLEVVQGFSIIRRIVRQLVPRNPQLDRPIAQTCLLLESDASPKEAIVLMLPHASGAKDLPWYHPAVEVVAYWYKSSVPGLTADASASDSSMSRGEVSIHYKLFSGQTLPLDKRLIRTAYHLLGKLYKHGNGCMEGYKKQGKHDQLIDQKRVQDTYTELKRKHANRLCAAWVEQTEPSKHVFEDLGIAAYLIELWKDMYAPPGRKSSKGTTSLPPFPGFVDIGCGNGVLTEVLILSGYAGEGFDARRRKTWSVLSPEARNHLHETLCVPKPLFDLYPTSSVESRHSIVSRARQFFSGADRSPASSLEPPQRPWHSGEFPLGTFIISNHADELTPWTPLLACLSASPFLAIPCCSHNLSGARFRAPSSINSYTADAMAPSYFDAQKPKKPLKSIAIMLPSQTDEDYATRENLSDQCATTDGLEQACGKSHAAETGDLHALAPSQRSKQPSAYASLCEWVCHLTEIAGYVVERDQLRIPSTRNVGIIGRKWSTEAVKTMSPLRTGELSTTPQEGAIAGMIETPAAMTARKARVRQIVETQGADGVAWVQRCNDVLAKGGGVVHGRE